MSNNHGNTPAAWTGVSVALVGFAIACVALMLSPISVVLFAIGMAISVGGFVVFLAMARFGLNVEKH